MRQWWLGFAIAALAVARRSDTNQVLSMTYGQLAIYPLVSTRFHTAPEPRQEVEFYIHRRANHKQDR
jgi:hypothetical protein